MSGGHAGGGLVGPAGRLDSRFHSLDPRAKLLGLLGTTVVAVSCPPAAWPVWAGCALVLASVAIAARVPPALVWRRSRVVLPLVLLVAATLPFVRRGGETVALGPLALSSDGLAIFAAVAAKASLGTVAAVLLAATTSFPAVLRALEALRMPRLLVLIAALMYRYLLLVGDDARRMRAALAARGYRPRTLLGAAALGKLAAGLFVRAHARGERVHLAMLARGYRGAMPGPDPLQLGRTDLVFVALVAAVLLPLRLVAT